AAAGRGLSLSVAGRQGGAGPGAGRGPPQGIGDRLGVHESGRREVVGLEVGEAETESCWRSFLRAGGLDGVQLVISDAHRGLKTAIAKVFGCPGSAAPSTSSATGSATSPGPSSRWV